MRKEDKEYSKLRKKYLLEHPLCKIRFPACSLRSSQVHHKKGRLGDLLLDTKFWLSCCASCHEFVEKNVEIARELGFSINRLDK